MGVKGKRSKEIPNAVLQLAPMVQLRVDICGRVSECRICNNPIKSGQKRICVSTRTGARKLNNGGIITGMDKFYHPDCWVGFIQKFVELDMSTLPDPEE